jgi:hypothetical protein
MVDGRHATGATPAQRIEITRDHDQGRWVARHDDGALVGEGSSKTALIREVTDRVRASGEVVIVRIFAANGMFLEQRMYPRGEAARRRPRH